MAPAPLRTSAPPRLSACFGNPDRLVGIGGRLRRNTDLPRRPRIGRVPSVSVDTRSTARPP